MWFSLNLLSKYVPKFSRPRTDNFLQKHRWGLAMIPFLDSFTASIVQLFYVQKIWNLYEPPYRYM